jgi:ATP:ADP antiporter, AAA family
MSEQQTSNLARIFRGATRIEPEEARAALLSFSFLFLLMLAYNILKPVRDALAPEWTDVELASLWTINFVFSVIAVSIYGYAVSRGKLQKVIPGVYAFFALSFVAFYVGASNAQNGVLINKAFYVWLSLFSLFHISVFWSLMSDIFSKQQAPRLFGFIASGASIGTIAGSAVALALAKTIGTLNLMLVAATILVVILPMVAVLRRAAQPGGVPTSEEQALSGNPFAGFREFVRNRYLLGIGIFIFFYTFIGSFAYFELKNLMAANDRDTNTAIWAGINLAVNSITIVTAWFATSRITARLGVGKTLALVPVLVAAAMLLVFVNPVLAVMVAGWVVLKAGNYAITRPGREMLYTNVSREDRFKTKQVIDIVVYRGGDVLSGWAFAFLTTTMGLGMAPVAIIGAGVALVWAGVGLRLGRRYDDAVALEANATAASTRGGQGAPLEDKA